MRWSVRTETARRTAACSGVSTLDAISWSIIAFACLPAAVGSPTCDVSQPEKTRTGILAPRSGGSPRRHRAHHGVLEFGEFKPLGAVDQSRRIVDECGTLTP